MLVTACIFLSLAIVAGVFVYIHKISTETYIAKLLIYFFVMLCLALIITYIIHYGHLPPHDTGFPG